MDRNSSKYQGEMVNKTEDSPCYPEAYSQGLLKVTEVSTTVATSNVQLLLVIPRIYILKAFLHISGLIAQNSPIMQEDIGTKVADAL